MKKKQRRQKWQILLYITLMMASIFTFGLVKGWSALDLPPLSLFLNRTEYYPLSPLSRQAGLSYEWDELTQRVLLHQKDQYLTFIVGERLIDVNGKIQKLKHPPRFFEGMLLVPQEITNVAWWTMPRTSLTLLPAVPSEFRVDTVVIDAGHGGKDPGAKGVEGITEKDVVLAIARELVDILRSRGIRVHMTRDRDEFVSLSDRAHVATQTRADLFVSIHANAAPAHEAEGFEVYYVSEAVDDSARALELMENAALAFEEHADAPHKRHHSPTLWDMVFSENRQESIELAKAIGDAIGRHRLVRNRGIKSASFYVLKWVDKPAILIETGFVTNAREAKRLTDPQYQRRLAELIADGIFTYKAEYERTRGFTR